MTKRAVMWDESYPVFWIDKDEDSDYPQIELSDDEVARIEAADAEHEAVQMLLLMRLREAGFHKF